MPGIFYYLNQSGGVPLFQDALSILEVISLVMLVVILAYLPFVLIMGAHLIGHWVRTLWAYNTGKREVPW